MPQKYLFVANWKMYLTHNTSKALLEQFSTTPTKYNASIVLCPSFEMLALAYNATEKTFFIGAQDVSQHMSGPYTGQISAQSLKEVGCAYCIIGHSERRTQFFETDETIAQKMMRLCEQNITPIICIGENAEEYSADITIEVVDRQLATIVRAASQHKLATLCIAYEPIWAIGTGNIPNIKNLSVIFNHLENTLRTQLPNTRTTFLYGGSVCAENIERLAQIKYISGFLIGSESTNFQKFEKIVSLVCNKK